MLEDFISKTWPTAYSLKKATANLWKEDDRVVDIFRDGSAYVVESTVCTIVAEPQKQPRLVVSQFDGVEYPIHQSIIVQSYEFGWMVISRVGPKCVHYFTTGELAGVIEKVKGLIKIAGIKLKPHRKFILNKLERLADPEPICAVEDLLF